MPFKDGAIRLVTETMKDTNCVCVRQETEPRKDTIMYVYNRPSMDQKDCPLNPTCPNTKTKLLGDATQEGQQLSEWVSKHQFL